MFRSARLKLTAWYVLMIMLVSIFFSAAIYRGVGREFERRFANIETRLRGQGFQPPPPPFGRVQFFEDIQSARQRVFVLLTSANGVILVLATGAGYVLAGRTLAPIEKAMEEQKRFVSDASHELRTPLTALKTSIEVGLRDKKMTLKEVRALVKSNLEEVESLRELTNHLLELSRYQANGRQLVFKQFRLDQLGREALETVRPLATQKKITLKLKAKKETAEIEKESLLRLLVILLDNAVKYTPRGGSIFLSLIQKPRELKVVVKDTGVGVAKKDLPHIFERFYRVDQSRSRQKVAGYGLGLSVAKEIIELYHGDIKVDSVLGKGSVFTVQLPQKS